MTTDITRQLTIALTKITTGKLDYWNQIGLVTPIKIGNRKKPKVFYSWQQVLLLILCESLRTRFPLDKLSRLSDFLFTNDFSQFVMSGKLFFVGDQIYNADNAANFASFVCQQISLNGGLIHLNEIPNLSEIIDHHPTKKKIPPDIWADFNQRFLMPRGTLFVK